MTSQGQSLWPRRSGQGRESCALVIYDEVMQVVYARDTMIMCRVIHHVFEMHSVWDYLSTLNGTFRIFFICVSLSSSCFLAHSFSCCSLWQTNLRLLLSKRLHATLTCGTCTSPTLFISGCTLMEAAVVLSPLA